MLAEVVSGSSSSTAQIVTAIATVLTSVGGIVLAVAVLIPNLRNSKETKMQVQEVHTIVNQQRTDLQRYNVALSQALKAHGIEIPVDQSLPVVEKDVPS